MAIERALLTGATGFVGSNVARRLVKEGWDVHILVRLESDLSQIQDIISYVGIHYYVGITSTLVNQIKEINPSVVFHMASLYLANHKSDDIENLVSSNVLFSVQLVEAMAVNGCTQLVNTGTSWQHFNEGDQCPVNLYAATKQAFEDILFFYNRTTHIKSITLKLFDTYGPRDNRKKIISILRDAAMSGDMLDMSPGEQKIDLVYIDDVVEAYVIAAHRLQEKLVRDYECYSVCSGTLVSLRDLVSIASKTFGKLINVRWGARPYRVREVMEPQVDGQRLSGWVPRKTLEEGLRLTDFGGQLDFTTPLQEDRCGENQLK
ncbi:MAG: NAD(P)-dependent oxidoreductase [Pseudomonadota bacterium]